MIDSSHVKGTMHAHEGECVRSALCTSSRITHTHVALHAPDFLPAPAPTYLSSLHAVMHHVCTSLPRGACSYNIDALHSCMCVYSDTYLPYLVCTATALTRNFESSSLSAHLGTCMHHYVHCFVYAPARDMHTVLCILLQGTALKLGSQL